ncbi:hypothetical protein GO988_23425 [Hymenobacter sp. HMF4947]|uniref:Uncharacterized protein n=1 Tax=Hymenobacter ginkgonis TaxID=2682976 RepID=A0A7K1TLK4_9BACT|nr:hypothetical protein [Hymenobacter ginkgonis]MVN79294.1 hypothetical protein [Hymenobacter ginkgonis]
MKLPTSYQAEHRQAALSTRLQRFAQTTTESQDYVDQQVKAENLQHGVGLVLARLILALTFIDRSKDVFQKLLLGFNEQHGTELCYEDFENIGWVRLINNEVQLPRVVNHFIWQVDYYEKEGKPVEVPADKALHVAFLRIFYERCYRDARLTISAADMTSLLAQFAQPSVSIQFLIERDFIKEKNGLYQWSEGQDIRHLRNEIASALWLLTTGDEVTEDQFREYIRRLQSAGIWPSDLGQFLTPAHTGRISGLATAVLLNEPDLLDTGIEFQKIWLDSATYSHIKVTDAIPHVQLVGRTSVELVSNITYHKWRFHDIFDHQASRNTHDLLISLALAYDPKYSSPFANTIRLLEAFDRPYLAWRTFRNLSEFSPRAIPYLINDSDLAPLAFKALAKLNLQPFLVAEQDNRDEQHRQQQELLSELWLELFALYLDAAVMASQDFEEVGKSIGHLLYELAVKAFAQPGNHSYNLAKQRAHAGTYHQAVAALGEKRSRGYVYFTGSYVPPKLIDKIFAGISATLMGVANLARLEYLHIDLATVDVSIRLLQLLTSPAATRKSNGEAPAESSPAHALLRHIRQLLDDYFSTSEVAVENYESAELVVKPAKSAIHYFGAELVEWGYLLCQFRHLNLLDELATKFLASLQINPTTERGRYDDVNLREADKLRFFLKTLLLAYLDIYPRQTALELAGLPVVETLRWLEEMIEQVAAKYSQDDLAQGRIDVFEESLSLGHDAHWISLTSLLYRCLNLFQGEPRRQFIEQFFSQSLELGRMLAAINLLDSQELQDVVAERIAQVNLDDFIKSKFTITDLVETLIEAVNSSTHWELFAEPLLKRVQRHFADREYRNERQPLLFEIELLLLFKRKDGDKLRSLALPEAPAHAPQQNNALHWLKEYFLSIHLLYNEQKFEPAISLLEGLLVHDADNIRYAFQLYRARTLQATQSSISPNASRALLQRAQQDWNTFVGKLSEERKQTNAGLLEAVDSNSVHYLAQFGPDERFDQTVSRLSNSYLYSEELTPVIYASYQRRGLYELAYDYLDKATIYYADNRAGVPDSIDRLRSRAGDHKTVDTLKRLLGSLANQGADLIPKILPERLNGERSINEFILQEFVQAARVMVEKIEGVRQITGENQYNDLLQALLQLRFAVWGWSLHDQPRVGKSEAGNDAGEADLVIKSAGNTVALIEALNLKDANYTETHVLKCKLYINIPRYYIVVYHSGLKKNLDSAWEKYRQDVLDMAYPDEFSINTSKGFEILPSTLGSDDFIRVGKTHLGTSYTMFHVMIALGNKG